MRPPRALLFGLLWLLAAGPAPAQDQRWIGVPEVRDPSPSDRVRLARTKLETGRALRRDGKLDLAEAALRRGLSYDPRHPGLHRELARVLEAGGHVVEADLARARADALDPPPPPLPDTPLVAGARGVLAVLLPPGREGGPERTPSSWPQGEVAHTLEQRLKTRLPGVDVVYADLESVSAAREWLRRRRPRAVLTFRVERVYCGDSIKDGRFAMAWLRGAAERKGTDPGGVLKGRALLEDPPTTTSCRVQATARALEEILAAPSLLAVLEASAAAGAWSTASVRTLFPGLGERIEAELAEGEELLSQGRLEDAAAVFRRAATVDAEDPAVRTYLREAQATLSLSRELSRGKGDRESAGVLDPRFTPAQRAALEARVAEEKRRRDELLAALAVMDEDARLPSARILRGLRPVPVPDPQAFGPALARRRAGMQVEARAAHAPDGSIIATYYFPVGDDLPVLREEDLTQDGRADRWIAYAGTHRTEIFEAGRDTGRPDVRLVFSGAGKNLSRIEIDRDGNGRPERVFHYRGERLVAEARDTTGDGSLDTFDQLDAQGRVALREEDTDGDGEVDVRSVYEEGRLVRRELSTAPEELGS